MTTSKSHLNILWVQVWVLAVVQGAITLAWLICNIYLPQLLTQFGFPASLAELAWCWSKMPWVQCWNH